MSRRLLVLVLVGVFLAGVVVGYAASFIASETLQYGARVVNVEVAPSTVTVSAVLLDFDDSMSNVIGAYLEFYNQGAEAKTVYFYVSYLLANGSVAYVDAYGPVTVPPGDYNWSYSITETPIPAQDFAGLKIVVNEFSTAQAAQVQELIKQLREKYGG